MDGLTALYTLLIQILDLLLGWLLAIPRDLALVIFAAMTAFLMTVVRRYVTNQNVLQRCADDLRRLKELLRIARSSNDKSSVARYRTTTAHIKGIQLAADMRVLIAVIVPLGAMAFWATERLDFLPITIGEETVLRAHFPLSSVGRIAHVVPTPAFELNGSPITIIAVNPVDPAQGLAEWTLRARLAGTHTISIRHEGETATHPVKMGVATYEPPVRIQKCDRISSTENQIRRYLPLGYSLGSTFVNFPPWLVGYLILTLCLTPAIKRLLKVY